MTTLLDISSPLEYNTRHPDKGPVAQLGARINRTDEVEGSNPSRSTGMTDLKTGY